jgi:hypothetical protein
MSTFININRNHPTPIQTGISGIGAGTIYFSKTPDTGTMPGGTGNFLFGLQNVVGTFSALVINIEYTPVIGTGAYWEVLYSWNPLVAPMLTTACAEGGFFRLNVTSFTGGTSFDVWGIISQGAGASSGSGGGSGGNVNIFDSNGNSLDSTSNALDVYITGGSSSGTQYTTGTAVASPIGTAALGWDGTDVRVVATDSSGDVNTTFANIEANAATSATWNTTTTVNTSLTASVVGFANATFGTIYNSGTFLAGAVTFEATVDGSNWNSLSVFPVGGTSLITSTTLPGTYPYYQAFVGGFSQVRIRLSTAILGMASPSETVWIRPSVVGNEIGQVLLGTINTSAAGSVTGGTEGSKSELIGGLYTTGLVNLTNGQQAALRCDSNAILYVDVAAGQIEVVGHGGGSFDGASGSAVPNSTLQVGGSDGTDLRTFATDSSGQVKVLVENTPAVSVSGSVAVTGTFWQATQPVSGTFWQTTQPVSGTLTTNQGTANSAANSWPVEVTDGTNILGTSSHPIQVSLANTATNSTAVKVDGSGVTQPVSGTFWQTTQPVSLTSTTITGSVAVTGTFYQATQPVSGTFWQSTQPVSLASLPALASGTNTIGNVVLVPATSGGLSAKLLTSVTNSGQTVKSSAGQVYGYHLDNTENASNTTYFQFFNTTSPTVGTTAPIFSIPVPGGAATNVNWPQGIPFGTAIAVAATTTATGSTAPGTSVTANVFYF